jgi:hypothetical protein
MIREEIALAAQLIPGNAGMFDAQISWGIYFPKISGT